MSTLSVIPTIDLSVFLRDGDEQGKKAAKGMIRRACVEYGFFQAVNHGIPLDLMSRAMKHSQAFFALPDEEKLKFRSKPGAPVPSGYGKQPEHSTNKNEFVNMRRSQNGFSVLPNSPTGFRDTWEELYNYFSQTGEMMESIVNDCLGLPPNFLKDYNQDRSEMMSIKRYFPATETENVGISKHADGNVVTFVFQDEVGGLEVLKDGEWIPVVPSPGTIVVNIGDIIQVLSNNKFTSAIHRVTRQRGKSRYSFSFFYSLHGDKWVEPLPQFTTQIGESPKYRGFLYKEYMDLRIRNRTHPPARPEDEINITHYAISQPS